MLAIGSKEGTSYTTSTNSEGVGWKIQNRRKRNAGGDFGKMAVENQRERGDREKRGYEPFSLHAALYTGLHSWGVVKVQNLRAERSPGPPDW